MKLVLLEFFQFCFPVEVPLRKSIFDLDEGFDSKEYLLL